MSSKRKLWGTSVTPTGDPVRFQSKSAAYTSVQVDAQLWRNGKLQSHICTVYVDERDGKGWTWYERIDLREIVASWQVQ